MGGGRGGGRVAGSGHKGGRGEAESVGEAVERGLLPLPLPADRLVDLCDSLLCAQATWHSGHSLPQTVFTAPATQAVVEDEQAFGCQLHGLPPQLLAALLARMHFTLALFDVLSALQAARQPAHLLRVRSRCAPPSRRCTASPPRRPPLHVLLALAAGWSILRGREGKPRQSKGVPPTPHPGGRRWACAPPLTDTCCPHATAIQRAC
ncbi:hypothetical protein CLOM_g19903 [Closterium sp. NIES-68]|nr:hypothetical protein CLOM_g19903 [Closterium sp. NIES-68]